MATPTLALVQTAVGLVSAALYIWVARIVLAKGVEGEAKRANTMFALWWIALAFLYLAAPFYSLPPQVFGYEDLALAVTLLNVLLLVIVAAIWGLVYYLVYLYTGNAKWFWPIAAGYFALGGILLYAVAYLHPIGFQADGTLQFEHQQLSGAPAIALGLLFSLPVVLAALAYGSLFFRVKEPGPRYRIGMVAGAFILQFGWSTVSSLLQLQRRYPGSITLALAGNALGIVAAVIILLAFRPPAAIRARLEGSRKGGAR